MKKLWYRFIVISVVALAFACSAWAADPEQLNSEAQAAYDAEDYDTAFRLYSEAAELGHANAQNELGRMYRTGKGVAQDDAKAVEWYRKAAEQGHARGQTNYAWFLRNGVKVRKNEKQAVEWYRKAAEQGVAEAQFNLGIMYQDGRGIAKNYKQAIEWYRKAADQGHHVALRRLNVALRNGGWKPTAEERRAFRAALKDMYETRFPVFSSTTFDDKPVTDEIFAGTKLTVVNLWATWCPPCIDEMPSLAKLGKSMPEETQLVGIFLEGDDKGAISQAKKILDRAGADFLQIKANDVIRNADLGIALNVAPLTFFINSEGRPVGKYITGTLSESEFRAEIEERLELMERQEERQLEMEELFQ